MNEILVGNVISLNILWNLMLNETCSWNNIYSKINKNILIDLESGMK
jgi:hypothetical protein